MKIGLKARSLAAAFLLVSTTAAAVTVTSAPAAAEVTGESGNCEPNEGFGRMFPELDPASWSDPELGALGEAIMEVEHKQGSLFRGTTDEARNIDAGYTYVGQFLTHDITRDSRPNDLRSPVDPLKLTNGRTKALDLDSVYAGGPGASPDLYDDDGVRFKLGQFLSGALSDKGARDHLRNADGRATIGDGRNDENRITASLHTLTMRAHNRIADQLEAKGNLGSPQEIFEEARRQTIHNYQWAVLTDFLPTVAGKSVVDSVVRFDGGTWSTDLKFYEPCMNIPVEFAVAAHRFGHSMVRDDYDVNAFKSSIPIFHESFDPNKSLVGFQPSPKNLAIDWDLFFDQEGLFGITKNSGQQAYKPDMSLVPELRLLPLPETGLGPAELANRNLLRGQQLGLPSGQDVAKAMGVEPLRDDQVIIGPAIDSKDTAAITAYGSGFSGKAPLWAYLGAENVNQVFSVSDGRISGRDGDWSLGPVGGRIVVETIVGLLLDDNTSILHNPSYRPPKADVDHKGRYGFREIINAAAKYKGPPPGGSCAFEAGLANQGSWLSYFKVTNNSNDTVKVYRIDSKGDRVHSATVKPGATSTALSYRDTNMVFTDADGNCFAVKAFTESWQRFHVDADATVK